MEENQNYIKDDFVLPQEMKKKSNLLAYTNKHEKYQLYKFKIHSSSVQQTESLPDRCFIRGFLRQSQFTIHDYTINRKTG